MNARSRFAYTVTAIVAGVLVTACADKLFRPPVSLSPKIQLDFQTIGAQQVSATAKRQVLVAVAAYVSSVSISTTDTFRVLAGPVEAYVTGASQQITLNVDLTSCLADPMRRGSQSACSLYYGVWLHDSATFNADTSDLMKNIYDGTLVGPIDVTPGKVPTLAPITLSQSRFAVFQFTGDETLRLGGPQTPTFSAGPITGTVSGAAGSPPVLYTITTGFQNTGCTTQNNGSNSDNNNNCGGIGYNAAQLAIFQNGTWNRVSASQGVSQFLDVAAFSPTDVYLAAGPSGVYHYDGTSLSPVGGTNGESVMSIAVATSGTSKTVVAGTSAGNAWVSNTTTWQKSNVATNGASITAVCTTGPNEAFAAASGALFRFNGSVWTAFPSTFNQTKGDLQCPAPGQAFVWAQGTALLSWNGAGWTQLPNIGRTVRLAAVSPTEIYAAGDSGFTNRNFYRYDGTTWHLIATSQYQQPMQFRPWADPRGGAAYFASMLGRVEMVSGTSVHPVSYGPSIRDAIMTSASNAFVVGWNMFLARWNGSTWNIDAPPAGTITTRYMNGVFSDGPSNAWAVGTGAAIIHWDGSRWSVVGDSIHPAASQRDNYNAVWGTAGTVWIAGGASIVRCTSVTVCSQDQVSGIDSLYGIWGTSATNAWAVGLHGKILHFDGTQWTSTNSPVGNRLTRVWGSSATNVWAVGDSALIHYDGTSWTVPASSTEVLSNFPPNQQQQGGNNSFELGLWGSGPNDVYVGSSFGTIYRWDGQEWNDMQTNSSQGGGRIVAISGAVGGCGVIGVIDALQSQYVPTFLRGVGPTGCLASPMPVNPIWP